MNNKEIVNEIVNRYADIYDIRIRDNPQPCCYPYLGKIYLYNKSYYNPTVFFIFNFLHEVGHCETIKIGQDEVTKEFLATQWAIKEFNKFNLKFSKEDKDTWQNYIYSFTNNKNKGKYKLQWNI